MNRWRSFSSVPKEEMHISIPRGLTREFREYADSQDVKPNELLTYIICDALSKDPTIFGLHPLRDREAVDE